MLYKYEAIQHDGKIRNGYIKANSKKEAILMLKSEGFKFIFNIEESLNLSFLEKPREMYSKYLEEKNNRKLKELQDNKVQEEYGLDNSQNETSLFDSVKNSFSNLINDIQAPFTKQTKIKRRDLDEDIYEEIRNIIAEEGDDLYKSQEEKYQEHIEKITKRKKNNQDILETNSAEKLVNIEDSDNILDNPFDNIEAKSPPIDWDLIDEISDDIVEEKKQPFFKRNKVKESDIIMFTKRMKIMLQSGISIPRALEILSFTPNKQMQEIIIDLLKYIEEGEKLSTALSRHPKYFNKTYISLISIGEESGNLVDVLEDLSEKMSQEYKVKRKVKTASVYPTGILIVLAVIAFFGSKYMIPQFEEIFIEITQDTGAEMPLITKIVFGAAQNMPIIIISTTLIIMTLYILRIKFVNVDRFYRKIKDKIVLKVPKLNMVFMSSYMYNISANIALMIQSGISLNKALELTIDTINNVYIKNQLAIASKMIEEDAYSLSDALANQADIDSLLVAMALTGEESGEMAEVMDYSALYYNQELNDRLADLMEVIQPVSILLISLLVIPVVFAIFIPLLTMQSAMIV